MSIGMVDYLSMACERLITNVGFIGALTSRSLPQVLEALNRLLDDNRELLIPETNETIRPHEHFMLFATQNPPGSYGGRKVLSRAFRNRFVELQVLADNAYRRRVAA